MQAQENEVDEAELHGIGEVDKGDEEQIAEAHGKEMINGEVQRNSKDSGLLGSIKSLMRVCSTTMHTIKFWRIHFNRQMYGS